MRGYDFRRPDRFGREQIRHLDALHEVFARRFSSGLGGQLRALVSLEPVALDQLGFDDYLRSMPNPTVVGVVNVPPLAGAVTLELDVQLALVLVDRLLGGRPGPGGAGDPRRPTELETFLLRDLLTTAVAALAEALEGVGDLRPALAGLEYNPQFLQLAAPSETVLLVTYRLTVAGDGTCEGLLTLCYPASVAGPLLEQVSEALPAEAPAQDPATEPLRELLEDIEVGLTVRLRDCPVPARDVAALRVGDVLRLDHRVDEPALVAVGDMPVLTAHLGRRGRRLAVAVEAWRDRPALGWETAR